MERGCCRRSASKIFLTCLSECPIDHVKFGLNDRKRHCQVTNFVRFLVKIESSSRNHRRCIPALKKLHGGKTKAQMRENPAISDWVPSSESLLKGRSAGGWRSGRRRSGEEGGGGTFNFSGLPCVPTYSSAHRVPLKVFLEFANYWILKREGPRLECPDDACAPANRLAQMRENPVISDWVRISEGALKGCSVGRWRSGRRRSEGGWRRGHSQSVRCSVRAGILFSTSHANEKLFLELAFD